MPDRLVVRYCSPTLAGMKTASLFNYPCSDDAQVNRELEAWNKRYEAKGLQAMCLGYCKGNALIYIYRPKQLQSDLKVKATDAILKDIGYSNNDIQECLDMLKIRLKNTLNFPHEIGCFLGYPPEDVIGFIKKEMPCKLTGYWKVYGDVQKAKVLFDKYTKCTSIYLNQMEKGITLEQLMVAL